MDTLTTNTRGTFTDLYWGGVLVGNVYRHGYTDGRPSYALSLYVLPGAEVPPVGYFHTLDEATDMAAYVSSLRAPF